MCTNLHTFQEQKPEHYIKPGSKLLFNFYIYIYILEYKKILFIPV